MLISHLQLKTLINHIDIKMLNHINIKILLNHKDINICK
jgi:hypothetical protein